jgi:hypothetical protein
VQGVVGVVEGFHVGVKRVPALWLSGHSQNSETLILCPNETNRLKVMRRTGRPVGAERFSMKTGGRNTEVRDGLSGQPARRALFQGRSPPWSSI